MHACVGKGVKLFELNADYVDCKDTIDDNVDDDDVSRYA